MLTVINEMNDEAEKPAGGLYKSRGLSAQSFEVNGLELRFRPVSGAEIDAIAALENISFEPHVAESRDYLSDEIAAGNYWGLFLMTGEVAAYMGIEVEDDYLYLSNIAVAHSYRGSGLGGLLLGQALRCAFQLRLRGVRLHVSERNLNAISFYEKHAFTRSDITRCFYAPDEDAVIMTRDFSVNNCI